MIQRKSLEILCAEYGAELELSGDSLEATIPASGFLQMLSHLRSADRILVSTSVGPLPEENREEMLFELLNGQYYFRRTAGATLAADYRRTRLEAGGRSAASASGSGSGAGVRNIAGAASASAGALSDEDLMRAARSMAAV